MSIQPELMGNQESSAILSPCERYRYRLDRRVGVSDSLCVFIMLNPSTADATQDDPTIRRCMGFAKAYNCGRLAVANLFALRSTNPKELYTSSIDPIGLDNDQHILRAAEQASGYDEDGSERGLIVCAWGKHGALMGRGEHVLGLMERECWAGYALGLNKDGSPKHPLYLRSDSRLVELTKKEKQG